MPVHLLDARGNSGATVRVGGEGLDELPNGALA